MNETTLRQIAERRGPFAVVCLDVSHDTEDAARQLDLRRKSVCDKLLDAGATANMLALFERAIRDDPPVVGRGGRLLILDDHGVHADEVLPDPPAAEVVRVSSLPYLLPLVEQYGSAPVPHVVAVVDRAGCDLRTDDGHGNTETHRDLTDAAHRVAWEAQEVGAEVIVLAGEVAARAALHRDLPTDDNVVEVEAGGRAAGADRDALDAAVAEVLDAERRKHHDEVLETFATEYGREDGLAVAGLAETTAALRMANVDQLLIDADALGDRAVQVGADRAQVGVDADGPAGWSGGSGPRQTCRADEALPVAALLMGAEIVCAPGELPSDDGVAALLRHH
ncbi:baeRF2 domain-containing protein [Nocardia thailandica]|uniref:baeRF2 domain-containing protein n=1 Tax=Nocardia thailandica TaxID=257275 RepID=UPI000312ED3E|nr:hypothetical protein [Nocardia thailandica]